MEEILKYNHHGYKKKNQIMYINTKLQINLKNTHNYIRIVFPVLKCTDILYRICIVNC